MGFACSPFSTGDHRPSVIIVNTLPPTLISGYLLFLAGRGLCPYRKVPVSLVDYITYMGPHHS